MQRLIPFVVSLSLAMPALSIGASHDAQPAWAVPTAAAADRVYPPLPSLSLLPPASANDELAGPRPETKSRKRAPLAQEHKNAGPAPRLVVSDATRAYLDRLERQLDQALQKSFPPEPANDRPRLHSASEVPNRAH
ncbi:hypothetical protein [Cupriavidus sp. D39]|uniref:hypothetical protein n=1 Tax=Cupriavidus sp. D39 TaxID=2997877 RepID=UPI00226FCC54|nr:hypothetical protein [Cupriavidus sp. D39]MCY0853531.1 hypothetical protein [Cupriavidus sp. D39]